MGNEKVKLRQHELIAQLEADIRNTKEYILEHGTDPDGTYDTSKFEEH